MSAVECREGCAACCIVVSISSPIPGLPAGKPAGLRCPQLTATDRCGLYGAAGRPAVCRGLQPSEEMCGGSVAEVFARLGALERLTRPPGRGKPGPYESAAELAPEHIGLPYLGGVRICVNPCVLMSRNIGVRGASRAGVRKSTSNL